MAWYASFRPADEDALATFRDKLQTIDDFWSQTTVLKTEDFVLIGRYIQIYAYSTLNARKILALVQPISRPKRPVTANKIPDGDTFSILRDEARQFPECDLRRALVAACDILLMHRDIRHNFAHWAVRRAKKIDAYVILGANEKEVQRHSGLSLNPEHVAFGLLSIEHVKDEARKLAEHGSTLADIAAKIDAMRKDLPRFIAQGIAAQ
nr:hypothetical protein [uncultured Sphingomonas sp.]